MNIRKIATILIAIGALSATTQAADAKPVAPEPGTDFQPCVQEDDLTAHCVWDAKARGNHVGQSFKISYNHHRIYITSDKAKRLLLRSGWCPANHADLGGWIDCNGPTPDYDDTFPRH